MKEFDSDEQAAQELAAAIPRIEACAKIRIGVLRLVLDAKKLGLRSKFVLYQRFGFARSLSETAEVMGVSRERARQREAMALHDLREEMGPLPCDEGYK